jgi:hypothetical protein
MKIDAHIEIRGSYLSERCRGGSTTRQRSPSLLAEIDQLPLSAWRTVTLEISSRKHRTPRVYEQKARPHQRAFRQFFITDLGHDEPTILLTNDRD